MPAREFDEAIAVPLWPRREAHADEKLVRIDGRRHEPFGKFGKCNIAFAASAGDTHGGIEGRGDGDQFGGRIEVAKRTADRAAIARLAMADIQNCIVDQWMARFD